MEPSYGMVLCWGWCWSSSSGSQGTWLQYTVKNCGIDIIIQMSNFDRSTYLIQNSLETKPILNKTNDDHWNIMSSKWREHWLAELENTDVTDEHIGSPPFHCDFYCKVTHPCFCRKSQKCWSLHIGQWQLAVLSTESWRLLRPNGPTSAHGHQLATAANKTPGLA